MRRGTTWILGVEGLNSEGRRPVLMAPKRRY